MLALMENKKTQGIRNIVPDALQAVRVLYQHDAITQEEKNTLTALVKQGTADKSAYEQFLAEVRRVCRQTDNSVIYAACEGIVEKIEDEIYRRVIKDGF